MKEKIRGIISAILLAMAFLLLLGLAGSEEIPWQPMGLFTILIVSFMAILGLEIGQLGFFNWHKKTVGWVLVANYFAIMLLAPFPIPWPIQTFNTILALLLIYRWFWPQVVKEWEKLT